MDITLQINGQSRTVQADEDEPLLYVLRGDMGLNGARFGCGLGQCGACTVLVDGEAVRSCVTPAASLDGQAVVTLEGLPKDGVLHPVQQAFLTELAGQCAYCIPGMMMTAVALLREKPRPTEPEIREALDNNLCRCGSHNRIVRAIQRASGQRS